MAHPDKPTHEDRLGFEPFVKGIEDIVRGTNGENLPLTVGIYGPWGSGKTSFMLQLQDRLEATDGRRDALPVVWFEAWKYDRAQDVRSALIGKSLRELPKRVPGNGRLRLSGAIKNTTALLGALFQEARLTLNVPGFAVALPPIGELTDAGEPAEAFQTAVDQFDHAFSEAVRTFLENYSQGNSQKLVVLIDDLDRCLPDHVIAILEALKLFLDTSQCVFIIGVDRTVVERAVQAHYGIYPGVSGRDYLDKIIQVSFSIPPADVAKLLDVFREEGSSPEIVGKDWEIFEQAVEGNPLVFYRLMRAWQIVRALAAHVNLNLGDTQQRRLLMLATAVQIRFPRLHEVCRRRHEAFKTFQSSCVRSATTVADFDQNNAADYKEFWDDPAVRSFFYLLERRLGSEDDMTILSDPEFVKCAFNLSSRYS